MTIDIHHCHHYNQILFRIFGLRWSFLTGNDVGFADKMQILTDKLQFRGISYYPISPRKGREAV